MPATYFGFGSLVSRASIAVPVEGFESARIFGYRRCWNQPFSVNGVAFAALGLEPGNVTDYVDGVILRVADDHSHYFDEREAGYRQIDVEALHPDGRIQSAVTFEARELAGRDAYIPVSYLATVVAGFRAVYGHEEGFRAFSENTYGWEKAVAYDLEQPIYPRRPENLHEMAEELRGPLRSLTDVVEL